MNASNALSERRSQIVRQTLALVNHIGPLSAEQRKRLLGLRNDMDRLEEAIAQDTQEKRELAFRAFLRHGLTPTAHQKGITSEERGLIRETRDLGTAGGGAGLSTSGGGVFAPIGFVHEVDANMKYATPMMDADVVNLVDTETGAILPFPTDDDTSVNAELLAESTQGDLGDIGAISQAKLGTYKFGSKIIRASFELVQDESVDFPAYLAARFGARFGRGIGPYLTTGTGSGQPTGFLQTAQSGGTAVGASANDGTSGANSLGTSDLATLESSLDYGWRPKARWMMHASTLQALRGQRDKQGRRLFGELNRPGPLTLAGYPVSINNSMDQLQTQAGSPPVTKTPLAFGDFSQYTVRRAAVWVQRLQQRFADFGQFGFQSFMRVDGALMQASAIKTLQTVY